MKGFSKSGYRKRTLVKCGCSNLLGKGLGLAVFLRRLGFNSIVERHNYWLGGLGCRFGYVLVVIRINDFIWVVVVIGHLLVYNLPISSLFPSELSLLESLLCHGTKGPDPKKTTNKSNAPRGWDDPLDIVNLLLKVSKVLSTLGEDVEYIEPNGQEKNDRKTVVAAVERVR